MKGAGQRLAKLGGSRHDSSDDDDASSRTHDSEETGDASLSEAESETASTHSSRSETPQMPAKGQVEADTVDSTQREAMEVLPPASSIAQQPAAVLPDQPVDPSDWRHHVLHHNQLVNISDLYWDHDARYGQVRQLRHNVIRYYIQRLLTQGEPIKPIQTFLKKEAGVSPSIYSVKQYAVRRVHNFVHFPLILSQITSSSS